MSDFIWRKQLLLFVNILKEIKNDLEIGCWLLLLTIWEVLDYQKKLKHKKEKDILT